MSEQQEKAKDEAPPRNGVITPAMLEAVRTGKVKARARMLDKRASAAKAAK